MDKRWGSNNCVPRSRRRAVAYAHLLTGRTCDRATCACWVAAVRHGRRIMAHHLIYATIDWTRVGRTVAVAMAGVACGRHVANMVTGRTCHRATCACWVARVRHGCGIMAHHLIYATIHWTSAGGAPVVAITAIT